MDVFKAIAQEYSRTSKSSQSSSETSNTFTDNKPPGKIKSLKFKNRNRFIKCYNCDRIGHKSTECKQKKRQKIPKQPKSNESDSDDDQKALPRKHHSASLIDN